MKSFLKDSEKIVEKYKRQINLDNSGMENFY